MADPTPPLERDDAFDVPLADIDFEALTPAQLAEQAVRTRIERAMDLAIPEAPGVPDHVGVIKDQLVSLSLRVALLEQAFAAAVRGASERQTLDPLSIPDPSAAAAAAATPVVTLALTAEELQFGRGWHKLEQRAEGSFRWSGPDSSAALLVPVLGARSGWLDLDILAPGRRPLSAVGVTFAIEGEPVEPQAFDRGAGAATVRLPFRREEPADFLLLQVEVSGLATPTDWKPDSRDRRVLGVGLSRVVVAKTG